MLIRCEIKCSLINENKLSCHVDEPERVAGRLLENAVGASNGLRAVREERQVQVAYATLLSRHLRPALTNIFSIIQMLLKMYTSTAASLTK